MTDCLVVGAGSLGLLTALALQARGLSVAVLDQGPGGREASWAGGGILCPLYPWRYADSVNALACRSNRIYPALVERLCTLGGIDPEWTPSGLLILDPDEQETVAAWAARHAQRVEWLLPEAVCQRQAGLAGVESPALWMPDVAQVRNPRLMQSLRTAVDRLGIPVSEYLPATGLHLRDGRVGGVQTPAGLRRAGRVVLCAGAWTARLLEGAGLPAPRIEPVRGQMLRFEAGIGRLNPLLMRGGVYLIPRRDGGIVVGSTLEQAGFDKTITENARDHLREHALALFPELAGLPMTHHWAGLRPGAPSGVPYIGAHPALEGLHINAGHFRNGLVMGPASAELLADLITGATPALDPAPYAFDAHRGDTLL